MSKANHSPRVSKAGKTLGSKTATKAQKSKAGEILGEHSHHGRGHADK